MADLHKEFSTFHEQIALTSGKKESLRTARNAIRDRIRKNFKDSLTVLIPKFRGQGSYAMGTTVNPLGGEYDIDDGVYLQHLNSTDNSEWPTPETVHLWVQDAVNGHTKEKPINKKTCVRVTYAGQYHVDLPIYAEKNGKYHLAECGAGGWHRSDPLALTEWFAAAVKSHGEQLRRIVRYLKAWADFQSGRRGKMPNGLILTVYAVRNYVSDERDDVALTETLKAIERDIAALVYLLNPVETTEELTAGQTEFQKKRFRAAITAAARDANQAVQSDRMKEAADCWRKQFGDRFPETLGIA